MNSREAEDALMHEAHRLAALHPEQADAVASALAWRLTPACRRGPRRLLEEARALACLEQLEAVLALCRFATRLGHDELVRGGWIAAEAEAEEPT